MFKNLNSNAYLVGGAVRDILLGIDPADLDYVVEATVADFVQEHPEAPCVGKGFPVFIINGCEVALTRTEKSTGSGYREFECEAGVPIEDDLTRRDYTVNSIAMRYNVSPPSFLDPCGGIEDLRRGILRSMNPVAFIEDPLRMVRACRFLARFPHFRLERITRQLIEDSAHLIPTIPEERIELELSKMYKQSPKPSVFFKEMLTLGLLKYHFPTLEKMSHVTAGPNEYHKGNSAFMHTMEAIDRCKAKGYSYEVFVAVLCHDYGKAATPEEMLPHHYGHEYRSVELAQEFFMANTFSYHAHKLALCVARNHMRTHLLTKMRPAKVVKFIYSIRKEDRKEFFQACDCDHELRPETVQIIANAEEAIRTTKIVLPSTVKGKDAIKAYVNEQFTKTYVALQRSAKESK